MTSLLRSSSDSEGMPEDESGRSDTDLESESDEGGGTVSLTLERLESLHALASLPGSEVSSFAEHGMSKDRIRGALRHPSCSCRCTMPAKTLAAICKCFWRLSKTAQDCLLWSIQTEARGNRKQWSMQGLMVYV